MRQGRERVVSLILTDLVTIYLCWALALWGYAAVGLGHYRFGFGFYFKLWPVGLAFVVLNGLFRLYHGNVFYPAAPLPPQEELRRLFGSAFFTHVGLIAFLAFARQTTVDYSRFAMAAAGVLTAFCAQPMRDAVRGLLHRCGWAQIPVRVSGDAQRARELTRELSADAYRGFCPVSEGERGVEILILAPEAGEASRQLASLAERYTYVEQVDAGGVGGYEFVNQRRMAALRAEKRVLDLALAVTAFVVLLPFFVVVPFLIKLTSRGGVFYRQERLGKCGRPIRVWKFRSMYADADARLERLLAADPARRAEWKRSFKLADDPRVTPLGRFLRKTSIDEFPQLFNVFAGDMALVGPRPIVTGEVAHYGENYRIFSSVRPGVTGLWQASGRSDVSYARRVALDTYYVMNWSPWLDFWILKQTVGAVLMMKGAC